MYDTGSRSGLFNILKKICNKTTPWSWTYSRIALTFTSKPPPRQPNVGYEFVHVLICIGMILLLSFPNLNTNSNCGNSYLLPSFSPSLIPSHQHIIILMYQSPITIYDDLSLAFLFLMFLCYAILALSTYDRPYCGKRITLCWQRCQYKGEMLHLFSCLIFCCWSRCRDCTL